MRFGLKFKDVCQTPTPRFTFKQYFRLSIDEARYKMNGKMNYTNTSLVSFKIINTRCSPSMACPTHLHVFFGMRPTQSISDLLQNIKGSSSEWINDQKLTQRRFEWQQGYGAFSYCRAEVPKVIAYIHNQELHHQKKSFLEEYRLLLKEFEIEFDEQFIFSELE